MKHFVKILLNEQKSYDIKIEIIGLCANIKMGDKWEEFLTPPFIQFINDSLIGMNNQEIQDDVVLETIMLVSSICNSVSCAETLASKIKYIEKLIEKCQYIPFN